jgi:hypothetical protein
MLQLKADKFVRLMYQIDRLLHASNQVNVGMKFEAKSLEIILKDLSDTEELLSELEMPVSHKAAMRVKDQLQNDRELAPSKWLLHHLFESVNDELGSQLFLAIEPSKRGFYKPSNPPFGQLAFDRFPSAIDDILDASNCLALDQNTAVVFHLMRVMEVGLKVLAKEIGIPYAPSWESYLKQIRTNVEGDWKSKTDAEKARQPLYKDLAGDLQTVKIAWRNPTMHIVKKYTADEASQIYDCVKQFIIRLAGAGFSE